MPSRVDKFFLAIDGDEVVPLMIDENTGEPLDVRTLRIRSNPRSGHMSREAG